MKKNILILPFILCLVCHFTANAQWFYDDMGTINSGFTTNPWVNSTPACNPPGVTNLGVSVLGQAGLTTGTPAWFGGWDGVSAGSGSSGGALNWFGQLPGPPITNVSGTTNVNYTYSLHVTGSATITSITFGMRRNSNGCPTLSTFTINGTSYTPTATNLSGTGWFANSVTISPAVTVSGGTITIVIGFSGAIAGSSGGMVQRIDELKIFGTTVLPIELLRFTGKNTEGGNLLTWKTANEVNNKGFQVERQIENADWTTLDFVKANGKASTYQFTDNNPSATAYYRLRQIDNDGKETLSKVISIATKGHGKLVFYPNPISNTLTVNTEESDFQIFNLLGQQILRGQISAQNIDVSALPQGTYVLKVGAEQAKFVKQ